MSLKSLVYNKDDFGYLDLFSGIGGFHLGLNQAGIEPSFSAFSEIDKHASSVYQKHFINSVALGDVKAIKPIRGKINNQKIDLVTFGFPCQDLSLAGKREGLPGDRSSLFFEAIRLIEELKPDYFIFENVKGLFSSREGEDFKTILRTISDIGYDGQWQLVNSAWVLPQNRERIYFVGYPRKKCIKEIFPLFGAGSSSSRERAQIQQTKTSTIKARDDVVPVATPHRIDTRHNGRRFKTLGDDTFTLTTQDRHGLYDGFTIRTHTPKECERLQGFPDSWTKDYSDNQRYKMLGNTVTVPVVKEIISKIYNK